MHNPRHLINKLSLFWTTAGPRSIKLSLVPPWMTLAAEVSPPSGECLLTLFPVASGVRGPTLTAQRRRPGSGRRSSFSSQKTHCPSAFSPGRRHESSQHRCLQAEKHSRDSEACEGRGPKGSPPCANAKVTPSLSEQGYLSEKPEREAVVQRPW